MMGYKTSSGLVLADPFSLALDSSGDLYWWDSPTFFTRDIKAPSLPTKILFDKKIIVASVGIGHVLFKTLDGNLYGLGDNDSSQLSANKKVGPRDSKKIKYRQGTYHKILCCR